MSGGTTPTGGRNEVGAEGTWGLDVPTHIAGLNSTHMFALICSDGPLSHAIPSSALQHLEDRLATRATDRLVMRNIRQ